MNCQGPNRLTLDPLALEKLSFMMEVRVITEITTQSMSYVMEESGFTQFIVNCPPGCANSAVPLLAMAIC